MFKCHIERKIGQLKLSAQLEVRLGETLVIFGPSGCGKTTLLNLITGILEPESGELWIGDTCLYSNSLNRNIPIQNRHIGYIQQEAYLFPHLTVKENILYSLSGKAADADLKRYAYLIKSMGIQSHVNEYPSALSGGQKQRTSVCRALMMKPSLMVWDEPFSALDHSIRKEMRTLVEHVKEELGIPMIFVTHDLEEATALADELAVMDAGHVLQSGRADRVLSEPVSERVREILGLKSHAPQDGAMKAPLMMHVNYEMHDALHQIIECSMHQVSSHKQGLATFTVERVKGSKKQSSFHEYEAGSDEMEKITWSSAERYAVFYEAIEGRQKQMLEHFLQLEQDIICVLLVGANEIQGVYVPVSKEGCLIEKAIVQLLIDNQ